MGFCKQGLRICFNDPASSLLSVSNVHMQIAHNRNDIRPKWCQDFAERFSNSSRGFQVALVQQHF